MFNIRLKELMEDSNLTVKDLHKYVKVKEITNIYSWLRGDTLPSTENLVVMANLFKCSTDYLLGRTDDFTEVYANMKPFDVQLKKIMKLKKITQFKMRNDKVVYPSNFHKWFKLKNTPTIGSLLKLADYFGVSIDFLVGRE